MNLSPYVIHALKDVIIGDSEIIMPYLTGPKITDLFNDFCTKKEVYTDWTNPETEIKYSRKGYAEKRMHEINNTHQLTLLIERVVQPAYFAQRKVEYGENFIETINQLLANDGYKIAQIDGVYKVIGNVVPDELKVKVHFEDIQRQILGQINQAKYLIWVTVAWFTDIVLTRALFEKQKKGVNVQIIIYDDEINQKWGILQKHIIKHFTVYRIKYDDKTKMHNKFCIIDLKTVIHGSYNWTDKARFNDETIEIGESRELACTFADEFLRLKQTAVS